MNAKSLSKIIYRSVAATIGLFAVIFMLNFFHTDGSKIFTFGGGTIIKSSSPVGFAFLTKYTFWSNFICFLVILAFLIDDFNKILGKKISCKFLNFLLKIKFHSVVMITATFIFYSLLLNNPLELAFWNNINNIFYHVLFPFLFVLDWMLFDKKGLCKFYDILLCFVFPLTYTAIILFFAFTIKDFQAPYFFLDVQVLHNLVFYWIFGLICAFFVIASIYFAFDKISAKLNEKN